MSGRGDTYALFAQTAEYRSIIARFSECENRGDRELSEATVKAHDAAYAIFKAENTEQKGRANEE